LTCTPIYPPFLAVHRDSDRELDVVPLSAGSDGRYVFDWDALQRTVAKSTRVFLLCNPHNPVGRVFTLNEIGQVAAFCQRHDLIFCSDEIHCDLILDDVATPHVTALSLDQVADRSIILMAASKTYNIAGLACAFAVIPNRSLRRDFRRVAGKLLPEISPFGFAATEAAYRYGENWRRELIAYLRETRDLITQFVSERLPGISMTPMEATYLAWLDVRSLGLEDPCSYFERYGLGFSDGTHFGAPGFLRMNFGCPRSRVELALSRLESAVRARRAAEDT
jgi:cystathionine beta-lyase